MTQDPVDGTAVPETATTEGSGKGRTVLALLAAVAVVALLLWLGSQAGGYVERFRDWVAGLGLWAPVVYILGYAVATVAFIPGSALTVASGAIFGLARGTLYTFFGATLGSALAFLIARYFARSWVEKRLEGQPKFKQIDAAVGREGGKLVALMRLSPIFPYNLLNYALGLTSVRFLPYLLASFAMIPGTFLYVYGGKISGDLASGRQASGLDWTFRVVGLIATVAVTWIIGKKAKQALGGQVGGDSPGTAPLR